MLVTIDHGFKSDTDSLTFLIYNSKIDYYGDPISRASTRLDSMIDLNVKLLDILYSKKILSDDEMKTIISSCIGIDFNNILDIKLIE